jgi:DNA-binding NarL/FixJ family response regulator
MRVLIVDDHPLFRAGLKALVFELDSEIETAEAATLRDVQDAHDRGESFDLILLDMNLPDGNGVEALARVKGAFEAIPVVVMSAIEDPALIRDAIDQGACGYIPKTTNPTVTVHALRLVLAHGIYLPPVVLRSSERPSSKLSKPDSHAPPPPTLSERQLEVLQRLLHGKPNKIIARELAISEGTVKAHLAAIYQFLNVTTRTQALYRAHELGLFDQFETLSRR